LNLQESIIYPGLENPVADAQTVFRKLLSGASEPGLIMSIDNPYEHPEPLSLATYAIALTLFDQSTHVHLSPSLVVKDVTNSLRFHAGVKLSHSIPQAHFVICNEDDRPDMRQLNQGSETYPDQSCTLIIQCKSFSTGDCYQASGPGIENNRRIRCSGIDSALMQQRKHMQAQFPRGIDIIMVCEQTFLYLPRTTQLIREYQ
jgi:alpha-D-ribose 1-methylphosphonate 5-triphosphate synthase subunit PhnH